MYPLTEQENLPKALLPIANKPMIHYILNWLENAGISNVIVIGQKDAAEKLTTYFNRVWEGTRVDLVILDDYVGTADALRHIKDKIQHDFIVLSCDAITTLPPHPILDFHRIEDPTMTALFFERPPKSEGGGSSQAPDMTEFVVLDQTRQHLAFTAPRADMDSYLSLRMSLLRKFPILNVYTNLQDAHLYIFKKWVIDLIAQKKQLSSIRSELLPFLIKCQYVKDFVQEEDIEHLVLAKQSSLTEARNFSTCSSTPKASGVSCQVFTYTQGYSGRANTVPGYCDINRYMAKSSDNRIAASAEISSKTQVGPDSMVGEGSKIGDRCSVKKSVIGSHCTIGKNVKITNSVIMDYVEIHDDVKLEGVVICNNAKIEEKCQMKDCEIGASHVVEKESAFSSVSSVKLGSLCIDLT
ncbi:nucleotide-diphospho-sugar transferase [Paraphysoderma sedebokerense]|nr:nucleotide-diphospho-sugar transferase [Paraphysoderma sedebokerense]